MIDLALAVLFPVAALALLVHMGALQVRYQQQKGV